ncbi:MAG: Maf family nucleotide pyrophosphatase [Sedimenticola sp.]|nr:Maf family nucleotide pyrophosphatase [Sedimenticola sp.]
MNSSNLNPANRALPIVLGSTSPFRRELLTRLGLQFSIDRPEIDEHHQENETATQLVTRLAAAKARAVAKRHPESLIIGSDQVACIDDRILGKPGNRENAIRQLSLASGRRVSFYTGLCLLNSASGREQVICEPYHVHFRTLDRSLIERYLDAEKPFNCAGSFKSEGLGIVLFSRMEGDDPNSLIGLPLIRLVSFLENEGVIIP